MADPALSSETAALPEQISGCRVGFLGKLVSMARRDAQELIRERGGVPVDKLDATLDLLVVGDHGLPFDARTGSDLFDAEIRAAIDAGTLEIVGESQLWERVGLVEQHRDVHRLYTPALLAELLQVPVAVIRRWHRRGLIVPARQVRRLPYFDFQEVATARRLAEMLAAGVSPQAIERKLASLASHLSGVERPLAQLSVIVEGGQLLLRQGDGLIEPGGQLRFDFDAARWASPESAALSSDVEATHEADAAARHAARQDDSAFERDPFEPANPLSKALSAHELLQLAGELEDEEELERAAETYRASLAAGGPHAETCFRLAELLYRRGDLQGARERYYMVIEIDDDFVEARANLGCVLMELEQYDLAEAAFQGALAYHGEYPDAHYHLARLLDERGRAHEAVPHWRAFLQLSPTSPWAEEAAGRLSGPGE